MNGPGPAPDAAPHEATMEQDCAGNLEIPWNRAPALETMQTNRR
jgi:hypothetical protein